MPRGVIKSQLRKLAHEVTEESQENLQQCEIARFIRYGKRDTTACGHGASLH